MGGRMPAKAATKQRESFANARPSFRGYSFGRRLRPPRGTTYMNTINATMTTAAMATMATVDAATITRDVISGPMCPKT